LVHKFIQMNPRTQREKIRKEASIERDKLRRGATLEYERNQTLLDLEKEKLLTPEQRENKRKVEENCYYSNKLTAWADYKCSWLTPRYYCQGIETELIGRTALTHPTKVNELRDVFRKTECGLHQYDKIQNFMASFVQKKEN